MVSLVKQALNLLEERVDEIIQQKRGLDLDYEDEELLYTDLCNEQKHIDNAIESLEGWE
jgi:hypothetical protein